MDKAKSKIVNSPMGSVFTLYSEEELNQISNDENNQVIVSGSVNSPGIINLQEETTLKDIINMAGGIINNSKFKTAQLGMPFGNLYTIDDLNEVINVKSFQDGLIHSVIILSEDDCIVQYFKFYVQFLLGKMNEDRYSHYIPARNEIIQMYIIIDRISKGRSSMRDIYELRQLSQEVKEKVNQKHNLIQNIIKHYYEELKEHVEDNYCYTSQCNHLTKLTITQKCIGCDMCKKVCPVDCIEGEFKQQHNIDYVRCTHCGQCVQVCPVNAIKSGNNTVKFLRDIATPNKIVITQMAPSVRVTIGEAFGFEPGVNVENKIAAALRKLGIDYVFDTTWAADLTVMEEAAEFTERLQRYLNNDQDVHLPILTSCCPAWVKFIEQNYNDMLDVPSSAKSPMEMFGVVAKDIWGSEKGLAREQIASVAIMPCLAKKYEASRPEFSRGLNYDVDYVITTAELIEIFKSSNIDLKTIDGEEIDQIMGEYTGAGVIFGRTGGVIEAATRTAIQNITGKRVDNIEFTCLRGWEGFRSCELDVDGLKLKIGVAHGLKEAAKMLDKIRAKEEFYHAIEIMACQGGCIGGGGQPKAKKRDETLQLRMEGLNAIDRQSLLRRSNENPEVLALYAKYLGHPLSHKAHELLHTKYFMRRNK